MSNGAVSGSFSVFASFLFAFDNDERTTGLDWSHAGRPGLRNSLNGSTHILVVPLKVGLPTESESVVRSGGDPNLRLFLLSVSRAFDEDE